ncbi:MAG: hypothetical protein AB7I42_25650 [Bradyrhizobium sp.]|uniref:hypothetical protein n=1 Tax=Bradyrhizobium sp. TaxID=376 RepID=UPI003D14BDB8
MSSRREQILQAVATALAEVPRPDQSGYVPVYRDPSQAQRASARYALIADWTSETVESLTSDRDECSLRLTVGVLMVDAERQDETLDQIITAAHAALMADRTLGGLCSAIYRRAASRDTQVAEQIHNEVSQGYEVVYRHKANDMEAA